MSSQSKRVLVPGLNGREVTADYNKIFLHEGTSERRAKLEMFIAKRIGERVAAAYPNRQWSVEVDLDNQMVVLMCPSVSMQKGYHLHFQKRTIHDMQLAAVKAAGEILERHNVSRSNVFNPDILETLPRDLRDNVIARDAAPERY
jgi:hypothetical protein